MSYDTTKSRVFQWFGIILIIAVFGGAYWYFKVYGSTLNKSPTDSLTSGLVGYWTFDGADVSGTTATDRSGNSNTGTLTNGPAVTQGKIGQALSFDGSDDYVIGSNLVNTAQVTVSAWIYKTAHDSTDMVVTFMNGIGAESTYDKALSLDGSGYPSFAVYDGLGKTVTGSSIVPLNQWVHLVGTADGSTVRLYMNSVLIASTAAGNTYTSYSVPNIFIGRRIAGESFVGKIDEVRVYNAALTAAQIESLYAQGSGTKSNTSISQPQGTGRLDSGLAGYWKLDDGSGTSATDVSTNGNTGTLTNGPTWTTGQIGGAVNFDGTDDYVSLPNVVGVSGVSARTISVWIYPTGNSGIKTIVGWGVSNPDTDLKLHFNVNTSNDIYLSFNDDDWYTGTGVAPLNQWTHVVFTYAGGTTSSTTVKIYINGVSQSLAKAGGYSTPNTSDYGYRIGSDSSTAGREFMGKLDEVRIYSRALSADEVAQLYRLTTPTAVDTGLKGYWSFNAQDMSSTTAYDRSGAGNTGTLSGPTVTEGKAGQALSFDGTNDYVTVPDSATFDIGTATTFAAWFKVNSVPSVIGQIFHKLQSGYEDKSLYVYSTGQIGYYLYDVMAAAPLYSNTVVTPNVWYHVVATYDGSTARLYINGALDNSKSASGNVSDNDGALEIGRNVNGGPYYFNGAIDEARVYNRVLTAAEVKGLYDVGESDKVNSSVSQAQGTGRLDSGLAGYWKLDDGSGTSATDASTNGNTGTLTSSPTWSTGQIGGAVTFNDNYVNIPDSNALDGGTKSLSWSFWMKTSQNAASYSWPGIVAKEHNLTLTPRKGWQAYLDTSSPNKVKCAVMYNDLSDIATSDSALNDNTWHHITCVRNVEGNGMSIYVDGVLNETSTLSNTGSSDISNSLPLEIGARNEAFSTDNGFVGQVDEVRVYSRALSAGEAADLYRLNAPTGTETGLKGYWSFNGKDVSGTTAYDRSGAGNTGTLTGGPAITEGKIGQGLRLDGINDYVLATLPSSLPLTGSLSFWFKPNWSSGDSTSHMFFGAGTDDTHFFRLQHWTDNNWYLGWQNATDYRLVVSSGTMSVARGAWYHMVLTWTNGSGHEVYLNGTSKGSNGSLVSPTLNSSFYIGSYEQGGTYFDGDMDEVRLYNRALTAAEIAALYNSSR